jgi:hypothetical protein
LKATVLFFKAINVRLDLFLGHGDGLFGHTFSVSCEHNTIQ